MNLIFVSFNIGGLSYGDAMLEIRGRALQATVNLQNRNFGMCNIKLRNINADYELVMADPEVGKVVSICGTVAQPMKDEPVGETFGCKPGTFVRYTVDEYECVYKNECVGGEPKQTKGFFLNKSFVLPLLKDETGALSINLSDLSAEIQMQASPMVWEAIKEL